MSGPPRDHHFIPQSWIKRFRAADGELWSYDWNSDRVKVRSSKEIMKVYDLYTVEPEGVRDTSAETGVLGTLDNALPLILFRTDAGERSPEVRKDLAGYLAAQIIRDPEIIASYAPMTQVVTLSFLDALDATSYEDFTLRWAARYPGTMILEEEFVELRAQASGVVEGSVDAALMLLETPGGTAEAPFTDALTSPVGRSIVETQLLSMDWTIKTAPMGSFILGDRGVLYDKGKIDTGVRLPLSTTQALHLTPAPSPQASIADAVASSWEVENLNVESASRARRWLAGDPAQLEALKRQVRGGELPKA